jgi:hypothetical protein
MPRLCALAVLLGVAGGAVASGCGDDGGDVRPESAASTEIRRAVNLANSAFAKGEYKRSCSFYTPSMQRKIAGTFDAASCERAQASAAGELRASVSPAQFRALTTYGIESVDVNGNSALAHYGPLPAVLEDLLKPRAALRMKRIDGRWLIASLPS